MNDIPKEEDSTERRKEESGKNLRKHSQLGSTKGGWEHEGDMTMTKRDGR